MKILIGLVHNNDTMRNAAMQETVEVVRRSLSVSDSCDVVSEYWQPKHLPMGFSDRVKKFLANTGAHFKILSFVAGGHLPTLIGNWLHASVVTLSSAFREVIKGLRKNLEPARTLQLSIKHFLLWRQFVQSSSDYLLVLEDDAIIFKDRIKDLSRLWSSLDANYSAAEFIMVGAGYSFAELGAEKAISETSEIGIQKATRPFANTASAYVINRETAKFFATSVSLQPKRLNVNADFLISQLLREIHDSDPTVGVRCLHFVPPIFDNASLFGRYKSSVS